MTVSHYRLIWAITSLTLGLGYDGSVMNDLTAHISDEEDSLSGSSPPPTRDKIDANLNGMPADLSALYGGGQQQHLLSCSVANFPCEGGPDAHELSLPEQSARAVCKKPAKGKKRIVVNLSRCKYDIVRNCVLEMGWVIDNDVEGLSAFASASAAQKDASQTPVWSPCGISGPQSASQVVDVPALLNALLQSERCQLLWSDVSVLGQNVARLKPWQRVNHFPQMSLICRKASLSRQLNRMQSLFPDVYTFFPQSWSSRTDLASLTEHCRKVRNKKTFILKPNAGCQGIGIVLSRHPDKLIPTLPYEEYVVQQYISRPLLIERKKFDMRVYVLVLCVAPLKVLIYDEGLIRMCTKDYVKPKASNFSQATMHLTNYAVNKKSDDFTFGGGGTSSVNNDSSGHAFQDDGDGSKGYKRDFKFFKQYIDSRFGPSMHAILWQRIERAVVLTILSAYHQIKHAYLSSNPAGKSSDNRTCFELLGFDILLDEMCNPYVLEVNHSPSFATDSAIDYRIKRRLLLDLMRHLNPYLIDVRSASVHQYEKMLARKDNERRDRDMYQSGTGFRPIFPATNVLKSTGFMSASEQLSSLGQKPKTNESQSPRCGDEVSGACPQHPDSFERTSMLKADVSDDDVATASTPQLWTSDQLQNLYDTVIAATTDTLPGQTSLRTQKAMSSFTCARREVATRHQSSSSSSSLAVAGNTSSAKPSTKQPDSTTSGLPTATLAGSALSVAKRRVQTVA